MNILVISDYRLTNVVRPEAEIFIDLQKDPGIEVIVITYPDTEYKERFETAGIQVIEKHPVKKLDWLFIKFLRNTIQRYQVDIMHLFNSPAIINGLFAAYFSSVKVALYRGYTGHIHWYDPTAYLKYLNPRVDGVACLTASTRKHIARNWTFKNRKAVIIKKGHDIHWYADVERLDLSMEFAIPPDAFVCACVANVRPFKGIKYLLEATYQIKDSLIYLLIIGRGMENPEFKKQIEDSPMRDRIICSGYREDAYRIVKSCDIFVLPSIGGEAITKSVVEAMSMGITPIITDISGNRGLVIHQENGILVPAKDPQALAEGISHLFSKRELLPVYGKAAQKHIESEFNHSKTVEEYRKFYINLLK